MDEIKMTAESALKQAETHTARIAKLHMVRPINIEHQIEITIEIASEGVALAACMAAVFMLADMARQMTVIDAESREVASDAN